MWRGTWQSVTSASVGWVIPAMILLPRDSSLYTQCRVHNGNLLGDVSINHTSAVDVVCDCVRMSALVCVWGGRGDNSWVQKHVHAGKGWG